MSFITDLQEAVAVLEVERNELLDELDTLSADEERTADEITERSDEITVRAKEIQTELDEKNERLSDLVALEEARQAAPTAPNFIRKPEAPTSHEVRDLNAEQLTEMLTRNFDANGTDDTEMLPIVRRHRGDRNWLTNMAARSTPEYTTAFGKVMTGREMLLTEEERALVAVGTSTQGGLLVPTHLDPTFIITNSGVSNVIRGMARKVTLTNANTWNGVTTAGSDFSWDTETVEVSDDSPTFAAASIATHVGAGFIVASYQAFEDIENLASDVAMLLADGRDRLEAAAHATGTGSDQPTGIVTALDANTNVEVVSTTAATIGLVDLQGLRRSVPVRHRGSAKWLLNPIWGDAIKALGTAWSASYSGDITEANTARLLGSEVVESDEMPSAATTTVKDNEVIIGDFSQYVIVDKPGSTSLEFIPVLTGGTANYPNGTRGWYQRFRSGADSVNDLAFRLLQDKTSA